jgi:hypothetical protein
MTTMDKLTRAILKARKRGKRDFAIAKELGVDAAEIKRLLSGKYPGEKVAARLGLPVICHTCKRKLPKQRKPRKPAPKIGQPGWELVYFRRVKR